MGWRALLIVGVSAALAVPAAGAAAGPKKAITRADQALAQSIVVKRSDLPAGSWHGSKSSGDNTDPACPGLDLNMSDLTLTGDGNGLDFQDNGSGTFVSSGAGVFRTAAQARAYFTRFSDPRIARCIADAFKSGLPKEAKARILSAGRRHLPRVATDVSGWRVVGSVTLSGRRVRMVLDLAVLRHGRGGAIVFALGLGKPFAQFAPLAAVVGKRLARA